MEQLGREATGRMRREIFDADFESMEGAAFMYACRVAGVPFAQVRAVSNRVERRNRAGWDLVGAVQRLGRVSRRLLEQA